MPRPVPNKPAIALIDRDERDILADVLIAVTAFPGASMIRQNTGAARTSDGRVVKFGRKGQPDIIGCIRGRYVGIETKTQSGQQTKEQKAWQYNVERSGGLYILARSVEDILHALSIIP